MPGTFSNLKLHLIFSTKHREPHLKKICHPRIHDYLGGIIRREGGHVIEINGVEDHVHILFGWRTDESISNLLRKLKSGSSNWIHETFPDLQQFYWQEGYSIFSVSQSQIETVRAYIRNQEEHHRVKTYKEELLQFLRNHQVEFDERYVFD